jgi:uncharacterized RDD family membrane protein YckC
MEIGLRVFALIIDLGIAMGTFPLVADGLGWILGRLGGFAGVLAPAFTVLPYVWVILYFAIPTGIWGKTLGKWICRLSVADHLGGPPGFWRALGRETLKLLMVGSTLGALLTFVILLYQGTTWYDSLCGTGVSFNPSVRLSETQKNWRRTMGKPDS